MKLYESLDAELSYQNFGSVWLMILRGKQEHIEQSFLGLWNGKATNSELEFTSADKTVAKFWSTPERMRDYFFNRHDLKFNSDKHANIYADTSMKELMGHSTIFFVNGHFINIAQSDFFEVGKIELASGE